MVSFGSMQVSVGLGLEHLRFCTAQVEETTEANPYHVANRGLWDEDSRLAPVEPGVYF